ncbi:unnamed protein product [Zymoseptoria tritici ST99CH_1A5]|uniref:Signal peptidase complex subunit 2 n=4 Tax=Zymoseptoria tritici TaxID=1047171 RepID=A0A1X7RH47_ZYMT9|nr:unnamed protein product [Zymoseptoria tritici ST99CH_3D7]SMR42901.1 unnamed protein product [Zymoseptoria tritici ST99CH_1E4]SMR45071.1 unnamed protein product [Zymoseptoria tritici ST99CH_3D1]SMY20236.1 unnamed protein product [Zymoseptoria tritici ST99CH_1A5]
MSEGRISVYSQNDLKNTTDDALGNYLRGLNFKQDHSKIDTRLALGFTGVVIAGALFYADFKLGWEATRSYTAPAVGVYLVLNTALTAWMYFVEKGLIFEGTRDGKKLSISSSTKKHDPSYYLDVSVSSNGSEPSSWQVKTPFTTFFTRDGFFVAQPFQQWLATTVEVVGNADLKNASRDERDNLAAPTATFSAIESTNGDVDATGAESKGKGTKRSKKT